MAIHEIKTLEAQCDNCGVIERYIAEIWNEDWKLNNYPPDNWDWIEVACWYHLTKKILICPECCKNSKEIKRNREKM